MNLHGKKVETINTTLPIFIEDRLVGAVEIAKDYTRLKMLSERLLDLHQKIQQPKRNQRSSKKSISYRLSDLKTIDPHFLDIKRNAEKLAKSDSPMLIYGESGTGKNFLYKAFIMLQIEWSILLSHKIVQPFQNRY